MAASAVLHSSPAQQKMLPGTAPYDHLFGVRVAPKTGNFTADTSRHCLATYDWKAVTGMSAKGTLVLVHGFAEHLGRYGHVATFFAQRGYDVCGIDHYAHGLSEGFAAGNGGYLRSIDDLVNNWVEYVLSEVAPRPGRHFVYAHSTGGTVALLALDRGLLSKWERLEGVVYSAPLIRQASFMAVPLYCCPACALGLLSCCMRCGCGTCVAVPAVRPDMVTSFAPAQEATRNDPLNFGAKANLTFIRALLEGTLEAQKAVGRPGYPFLVMVSPGDQLVSAVHAKLLYEKAPSLVKHFESEAFAGWEHELHNEEDWQKPLKTASAWLDSLAGQVAFAEMRTVES